MHNRPHRRGLFGIIVATALILGTLTTASAQTWGEFYVHDDNRYWWFRDRDTVFEVALPANPAYVIQRQMFGEDFLELVLADRTPYMQVARFEGGDREIERARQAIADRWGHALSDVKVTENRTIRTNKNLDARFTVIQGRTADGQTAMVRTVLFTAGGNGAYLVWTGLAGDYTGVWQQAWIEAVNSFTWLR